MAEHLRDEERSEVAFVGTPDGLEARIVPEAGIDFLAVPATGYDRSRPMTAVSAALSAASGFMRCLTILSNYRPDVVVCFGGYASLPLGLAAAFSGVPLVIHEQNAVPGLANRVLSRWALAACVTYAGSIGRMARPRRCVVTGDPVRQAVLAGDRERGRKSLGAKPAETLLLVFGGSRGARHINEAMLRLHPRLSALPGLRVAHLTGEAEHESVETQLKALGRGAGKAWKLYPYLSEMGDALAAADLVVCRAGATTIAEVTALGRPAILVPYPYATDDHQTLNAQALEEAGAALVVRDEDLDGPLFSEPLMALLADASGRDAMADASRVIGRPTAAAAVAEVAHEQGSAYRHRLGLSDEPPVGPSTPTGRGAAADAVAAARAAGEAAKRAHEAAIAARDAAAAEAAKATAAAEETPEPEEPADADDVEEGPEPEEPAAADDAASEPDAPADAQEADRAALTETAS